MRHPFAICAIMKDEARYLGEWIEFHRAVGCSKFFLYDNESSDGTAAVVAPYIASGLAEVTPWSATPAQYTAYQHAIDQRLARKDAAWCAFIDIDEFLTPTGEETVPQILAERGELGALAVHWLTFGSSGHATRPEGLVIENYLRRLPDAHSANQHYKSIVNFARARSVRLINAHGYHVGGGTTRNVRGVRYGPSPLANALGAARSRPGLERLHVAACQDRCLEKVGKTRPEFVTHERLRLHHYFSKSEQDWQARLKRGDVNNGPYQEETFKLFAKYDRENVEDRTAARFAPIVRARLTEGDPAAA